MKTKLFVLILLCFGFSVSAQSVDTLVVRFRKMAVDYQQRVKIAESRLKSAELQAEAAGSDYLPKLDFNGNYNYYGVPLRLAPAEGEITGEEVHDFYALHLTLSQPVWTGGYLTAQKEAAVSKSEWMKNNLKLARQQVMYNADILYWNAVAKKEINTVLKEYRDAIGKFLKVINDRVEEEIVGRNELFQAKVRYNDAEFEVIQTEKEYNLSLLELKRFLGIPLDSTVNVADTLIEINVEKIDEMPDTLAFKLRPEVGFYESKVKYNKFNETLTASKYNPKVGVMFGGKWGSPSPGLNPEPGFNYYFKANFTFPIFYWGMKTYDVGAKQQITTVSELQLREVKDKVALEVRQAVYRLQKTKTQLDFSRGALENASKNVSVMLDRYHEGLSSVLEVLDAQLYWQKTYLNYVNAKYQLSAAYSEYLRATGSISY